MDKIISGYQAVNGSQIDEDVVLNKCRNAMSSIGKVEREIGGDIHSGIPHLLSLYSCHIGLDSSRAHSSSSSIRSSSK